MSIRTGLVTGAPPAHDALLGRFLLASWPRPIPRSARSAATAFLPFSPPPDDIAAAHGEQGHGPCLAVAAAFPELDVSLVA